jgi:hypothetical protein
MKTQLWSKNSNNTIAGNKASATATIIVSMPTISPRHDSKRNTGDTDS